MLEKTFKKSNSEALFLAAKWESINQTVQFKIISAGAGSGKTYRLTQEMVQLLMPNNPNRVRASGIIATTFTNKAAAELQERVRLKLLEEGLVQEADELTNALIGTVHGLGVKLLRRFAFEAGVSPEVDIIADEDQQILFNKSLAVVLKPSLIHLMEQLSERLGLNKRERYDWRVEVKNLTDIARSNAFGMEVLEKSKKQSIETFKVFFDSPSTKLSAAEFNEELLQQLKATIHELRTNADTTKTTQRAANTLQGFFNKLKNKGELNWHEWVKIAKTKVGKKSREAMEDLVKWVKKHEEHPNFQKDIETFIGQIFDISISAIKEYEEYKKRRGLIDYIDMEIHVKRLLNNEVVQEVLTEELDLLMVDEFQDTSPVQLEIFFKLSQFAQYSIWVGDPKQSIYGFRGADPELMQAIIRQTGGIRPEDIQEKSWRSREDIVHATNAIFVKAFSDLPKEQIALKPVFTKDKDPIEMENALIHWHFQYEGKSRRPPGKPWFENCIARNIHKMLEKGVCVNPKNEKAARPVKAGDIAVLCRSNNDCLAMAEALHREGLKAATARVGLLKTAETRLILACLKFTLNHADSLSIAEILLLASDKHIEEIIENRLHFLEIREHHRESWATEDDFIQKLHDLRPQVVELSSTEILDLVLEVLDLRRIIARWGNVEQRFSNIDTLRRYALKYEENCNRLHTAASLGGFLLWLNDLEVNNRDEQGSGESPDAVNVLTYHKSKGLEWPVVICHSLERTLRDNIWGITIIPETETVDLDNILGNRWMRYWINPYADQIGKTVLEERLNASPVKQKARLNALQEEARLLYVGITRARDYLVIPSRQHRHTKWLNRTWHEGKEDTQTLDPYLAPTVASGTYESPWYWNEKNIPIDTEINLYPKIFTYAEPAPQPIAYLAERVGDKAHFRYLYDFDIDKLEDEMTAKYGYDVRYTDPIILEEEADAYLVAKVAKAFLCADSLKRPIKERLDMAADLTRNFGATDMVDPRRIVGLSDAYYRYLHEQFQIKAIYRKYSLQIIHNQRLFDTIVDLILLTEKGIVIVQNSGLIGESKKWKSKALELASWMHLAKKAIIKAFAKTSRKHCITMIHFVMNGGLAAFETREKNKQLAMGNW